MKLVLRVVLLAPLLVLMAGVMTVLGWPAAKFFDWLMDEQPHSYHVRELWQEVFDAVKGRSPA